MAWLMKIRALARNLVLRGRVDRDLEHEVQAHLALLREEFIRGGMTAEEAERAARMEMGGMEQLKELVREERVGSWVMAAMADGRFALRQWRKDPKFSVIAILILALGMGVSLAIFGFVNAALLEPLPYAEPSRLMSVNESNLESPRWPLSYADFVDWQRLNKSFSSLDVYNGRGYLLRTPSGAEQVNGARVSGGFFQTLGVRPMLGRDFAPGENRPGGPNVVIVSHGAWMHRFGGRSDAVGQTVDLDEQAYTVIGVLPPTFSFARTGEAEFWAPINKLSPHEQMRTFYNFWGIGRLRDGVSMQSALAEMTGISKQLQQENGTKDHYEGVNIVPLAEIVVGDVRPILLTLLGGAGVLLLIACVNVASLLLVRTESRKREIAVRSALGATRARLMQQFVTEGLMLALAGCGAGLLVAGGMVRLLERLIPKDMAASMPFLEGVGWSAPTGAFAIVIALAATLLLAATPMLRLSSQALRERLAEGDRGAAGRFWQKLGANMVVVELAMAVVLLAGAGLLGQSFYRLLHVPLGFDPGGLATMQVMVPDAGYPKKEQLVALYREIVRNVASLPGVESVGMTSTLPVECNCPVDWITFPGKPFHGEHNVVNERHVSADYLRTLKVGLVRGRIFADSEDASTPGVVVINEALARKYFSGEDPMGQRISDYEGGVLSEREIIGVVGDVREGPLDAEIQPAEYYPLNQIRDPYFNLVARTRQNAGALLPMLVKTLHAIDPNLGVADEATLEEKISLTQAALLHRSSAWVAGGFAAMALVLGVVGLYAVIGYSVSRRTREIGIRMALGAGRGLVYRLVLREAGWLTGMGLGIGLVCAVGASLFMRSLLFGVQAWDAVTLACVAVVLGGAAMVASFLPARRAARVEPVVALREE